VGVSTSVSVGTRRPGPDVVRGLAMLGVVVMNYHGYLIHRGAARDGSPTGVYDLFDPWIGPLATRFAATFVVTAGVGVTLMTRSRRPGVSWRLVRRGLLLWVVGLAFDELWPGTILVYYGAMFVVAAALWRLPSVAVAAVGVASALAGFLLRWFVLERELDGLSTGWLTEPAGTPLGLVIDVFVNGTHPLFPWLAFLCAGIVLGRLFDKPWWRGAAIALGIALFSVATMASVGATGPRRGVLLASDPYSRSLVYTASALGTALVAFAAVGALADRFGSSAVVQLLRRSGQLSLTIYVLHALVFKLLVDWIDVVDPGTIWVALGFALGYWALALVAAAAYQRRFGRGPAEQLYRALTG
jgi:uncharacterized protein